MEKTFRHIRLYDLIGIQITDEVIYSGKFCGLVDSNGNLLEGDLSKNILGSRNFYLYLFPAFRFDGQNIEEYKYQKKNTY
jgi:hypothetical protein